MMKRQISNTCFYHALIQPNQISDVDGMYRNAADSIVKAGTGAFYSYILFVGYLPCRSSILYIGDSRTCGRFCEFSHRTG